jgi:hypothetical protein
MIAPSHGECTLNSREDFCRPSRVYTLNSWECTSWLLRCIPSTARRNPLGHGGCTPWQPRGTLSAVESIHPQQPGEILLALESALSMAGRYTLGHWGYTFLVSSRFLRCTPSMDERFLSAVEGLKPQRPRETLLAIEVILKIWQGFSWPSRALSAARRNHPGCCFFLSPTPQNHLVLEHQNPTPLGF